MVDTEGGRYAYAVDDGVDGGDTDTSFTSLEHHLFGGQLPSEEGQDNGVEGEPTRLHKSKSESDTVVQRSLDEPPPVQVITVLPPGSRPVALGPQAIGSLPPGSVPPASGSAPGAAPRTEAAGGGGQLIAAGGVFAGMSMVAGAGLVGLSLLCAVAVYFLLRPPPVEVIVQKPPPPEAPAPAPGAPDPDATDPGSPSAPPAPSPSAPAAPAAPPSPLRDGVRFPASFAFNDWKPLNVETQALFDLVAQLQSDCPSIIHVTGHTDTRGGDFVNDRIAIARAGEVRRLLEQQGIPRARMEVGSAGAMRPEDDEPTRDAAARNRRVTVQCN